MGQYVRPVEETLQRKIADLERRIAALERVPSGRNSIGIEFIRPAVKAGTPSDADYTAETMPPIGSDVTDTSANRIWRRTAVGTWRCSQLT